MDSKSLAIVGIFWDGYYDIWEDFLELKSRFWKDCPYPLYIINQTRDLEYETKYDVTVLHAGSDAEYSKKVQTALHNIDADYFLLVLEDFFFTRTLEGSVLDKHIDLMQKEDLFYLRLPLKEFYSSFKGTKFKDYSTILNISSNSEYTLSCQPSIWEKNFLMKCIGNGNYNAWVFEGIYAKSRMAHSIEFLSHCKIETSNTLSFVHGALQGKMIPQTIDCIKRCGYKMKNQRPMLSASYYESYERKEKLKSLIPFSLLKVIKKIIRKGSVLTKYEDEVVRQMELMGIV